MKRPALRLPSPAMVVALIALIVALGGTGYAATRLPGSPLATATKVGRHGKKPSSKGLTRQRIEHLIASYVGSHRSELTGPPGATGPAGTSGSAAKEGPQGPPGAPATTLFAYVHEQGTLVRGTPGATSEKLGTSHNEYYVVNFPTDVSKCVPEVSLGDRSNNSTSPGFPVARMGSDSGGAPNSAVEVVIFNTAGTELITGAFNLIVIC